MLTRVYQSAESLPWVPGSSPRRCATSSTSSIRISVVIGCACNTTPCLGVGTFPAGAGSGSSYTSYSSSGPWDPSMICGHMISVGLNRRFFYGWVPQSQLPHLIKVFFPHKDIRPRCSPFLVYSSIGFFQSRPPFYVNSHYHREVCLHFCISQVGRMGRWNFFFSVTELGASKVLKKGGDCDRPKITVAAKEPKGHRVH